LQYSDCFLAPSLRSDGIKYRRDNVRPPSRCRIGSKNDRSSLDGSRSDGIRVDVHHGIDDLGWLSGTVADAVRTGNKELATVEQNKFKQFKGGRVMTAGRTNTMKVGTKIGAGLGVLAFLVFGIIPGFYFGSYGT